MFLAGGAVYVCLLGDAVMVHAMFLAGGAVMVYAMQLFQICHIENFFRGTQHVEINRVPKYGQFSREICRKFLNRVQ